MNMGRRPTADTRIRLRSILPSFRRLLLHPAPTYVGTCTCSRSTCTVPAKTLLLASTLIGTLVHMTCSYYVRTCTRLDSLDLTHRWSTYVHVGLRRRTVGTRGRQPATSYVGIPTRSYVATIVASRATCRPTTRCQRSTS